MSSQLIGSSISLPDGALAMNGKQEADDALLRALAAEQQHLVLSGRHLVAKKREQLRPQRRQFVHQRKETVAGKAPHLDLGHRFCGEEIAVLEGHAEDVARIDEAHDRASTVRQNFVDAQYAFQDIEDLAGLIALPEQGFAGRKRFVDLSVEKVLERWREIGRTDGRMKGPRVSDIVVWLYMAFPCLT